MIDKELYKLVEDRWLIIKPLMIRVLKDNGLYERYKHDVFKYRYDLSLFKLDISVNDAYQLSFDDYMKIVLYYQCSNADEYEFVFEHIFWFTINFFVNYR